MTAHWYDVVWFFFLGGLGAGAGLLLGAGSVAMILDFAEEHIRKLFRWIKKKCTKKR